MWLCPKCQRQFKNTNQSHYCIKPETVDDYIAMQEKEVQPVIQKVREVILSAVPDCTEIISCHMPTFRKGKSKLNLIQLAAHKNHLGFYPFDEAVNHFANRLTADGYKFNKGCIHFPWGKPMPYELICEIVQYRGTQVD
jgi:uncharacterized protein YdhG (YjbR/CyaY superfamily)